MIVSLPQVPAHLCSAVPCSHRTSHHSHCGSQTRAGITSSCIASICSLHHLLCAETDFCKKKKKKSVQVSSHEWVSLCCQKVEAAFTVPSLFGALLRLELTVTMSVLWEMAAGGRQGQKHSAGHHQWQRFVLCLLNKCFGVHRPFCSIFHRHVSSLPPSSSCLIFL